MSKTSGFKFNIKVKLNNTNKIIKEHGLDSNGRVIRFLRDEADRLMMPFVPRWFWRRTSKIKNLSKCKYNQIYKPLCTLSIYRKVDAYKKWFFLG